tara:strand:+ start:1170 stop:1550 length:381 start_codon:yes stop_codon:yes gene_type:complete
MPKKVLWVSQHSMQGVQMGCLRRMYGNDVEVMEDTRPFDSAEVIIQRVRDGGYDDVIVVAPHSVLDRMCKLGLRPLWADAEQVFDRNKADWSVKGRHYRFLGFSRVKELKLVLEDLGPAARRQPDD